MKRKFKKLISFVVVCLFSLFILLPFNVCSVKADNVTETYNTVSIPLPSFQLAYSDSSLTTLYTLVYNFPILVGNINGINKYTCEIQQVPTTYSLSALYSSDINLSLDYIQYYVSGVNIVRSSNIHFALSMCSDYSSFVPDTAFQYAICSIVSYNSVQALRVEFCFESSSFYTYFWCPSATLKYFLPIAGDTIVLYSTSTNADVVYSDGYNLGFTEGHSQGYGEGYNVGYNHGTSSASEFTFLGLLGAVFQAPITALTGLLNFNLLGFNMLTFYESLFTLAIVFIILRFFFR